MILINKTKYLTSYQAILKFKALNPEYENVKLGYAGTLDPMATGLLIALEDEENKDRDKYIGLTKTYEFEILFGISTDSYDL
ncbi:MAG: tRNA pseudouridine(55) synthase, partial [bacterium]|nr:tRNA pseudouridine(55) synthase [bacterium]